MMYVYCLLWCYYFFLRYKIGFKEFEFFRKFNDVDLDDKFYCFRFYRYFFYKNYLCLVFEFLRLDMIFIFMM